MEKVKGFFFIESIPGVMFLNGTPFKECKQINNLLTLTEYNKALGIKSEKKVLSDKKLKTKIKDKGRFSDEATDKEENRFE